MASAALFPYILQAVRPQTRTEEIVDYTRLPPPVKYEELQRESLSEYRPYLRPKMCMLIMPLRLTSLWWSASGLTALTFIQLQ